MLIHYYTHLLNVQLKKLYGSILTFVIVRTNARFNVVTCWIDKIHAKPRSSAAATALRTTLLTIPEWIIGIQKIVDKAGILIPEFTVVVVANKGRWFTCTAIVTWTYSMPNL